MNVRLKTFACVRELLSTDTKTIEVSPGTTIESLWTSVSAGVPQLAEMRDSLRFAINGAISNPKTPLSDGDELAVLPPSSGG